MTPDNKQNVEIVDRIEVLVLIDNVTDSFSSTPDNFTSEWSNLRKAGMKELSGRCQCSANHGLSLIVRAWKGDELFTVLFDAGPVDYAVEYNSSRLGFPMGEVDAVVLSHGHWDHAGGMLEALDQIHSEKDKASVPVYLHPDMFRQRAIPQPGEELLPISNIPGPEDIRDHRGNPVITVDPLAILDGCFFVSGEIPRITSYEEGYPGHMRRTENGKDWEPDPLIVDERYLAVNVRDKGLVVFSACSHAGIVNVLHAASQDFPGVKVHGLMGGFHLSGLQEKIIEETVADFHQFDIDLIMPGHCTGWRAVSALERAFGEKVVPIAVGMSVEI